MKKIPTSDGSQIRFFFAFLYHMANHSRSPFAPDRFAKNKQTNKQTNKQANKPNIYPCCKSVRPTVLLITLTFGIAKLSLQSLLLFFQSRGWSLQV